MTWIKIVLIWVDRLLAKHTSNLQSIAMFSKATISNHDNYSETLICDST